MTSQTPLTPPVAPVHPVVRSHHGHDFVDDYEWLRQKDSPETIAYLEAENAYMEQETAHLGELKGKIYQELKSRTQQTDMSVPSRIGDYWYYARTMEGQDYPLSCRVAADPAATNPWLPPEVPEEGAMPGEEVLLDLNELAAGHDFFSLGANSLSGSYRYLAYSTDTAGDERFDLVIKDLSTGELLDDRLEGIFYGATWAGDDYIFYSTVDDAWRPEAIWRHRVGSPQSEDVVVYREEDALFSVGVGKSRSQKYLFIESGSKITSEVRVLSADDPTGEFEVLWERESGVEYDIDHAVVAGEDTWIVTHNATGPNFAVAHTPAVTGAELPALVDAPELVVHDDQVRIEGVDTYRDFMVLDYRAGGIPRNSIMALGDGWGRFTEIAFDEELYSMSLGGTPEWESPTLRLSYVSFTQPAQVFDYNVTTGERTLLKEQQVLGGYDASDYTAYRLWATADDGTQIPVSVIHRADLDTSTPSPTLLYGYGAYESSVDPGFSIARLSLLDRGMIFAIAHVRGGGEMGRGWYDHGKMLEKKNTFTDFIAVADHLVEQGLTSYEHMVAEGGSAGGMLVGAVANMAPEKFAGIQAVVPFVDSLTSMLMPELPLTIGEWEEWGDPLHDPRVYEYMASYSAYENVEDKEYPDIFAITSINDTRVLYVEPAKWVARLRATAQGHVLLKTEMAAGHGGVSGRYAKWEQTALEYAWTLDTATNGRRSHR